MDMSEFAMVALNPRDPAYRADPDGRLARLRAAAPAHLDAATNTLILTGRADVRDLVNDPSYGKDFSNARADSFYRLLAPGIAAGAPRATDPAQDSILFLDDPDHARIRQPLANAFHKRVAAARLAIEAMVAEVVAALAPGRTFDLVAEVAIPIPIYAIAAILGVERERQAEFRRWSEAVIHILDPLRSPEVDAAVVAASDALAAYVGDIMAARRADPRDDLVSDMVQAQAAGAPLSDAEVSVNLRALLVAGNLTTTDLISSSVKLVCEHPEVRARLAAEPGFASAVIEEVLRVEGPVDSTVRIALSDRTVAGCPVAAGTPVRAMLRAADKDPAAYPEPHRFVPGRPGPPHMAFGGGSHVCIGAALARMEARAALVGLLHRFPDLALAEQPFIWRELPPFRGLERLLVKV
jgi:hypothetical protein